MRRAPKSLRLHIGLFGRRNAGKSSTLNALTRQEAAIVSPTAGTTTDPVEKSMEMLPLGPVLFIDTAGIDDEGDLGAQRMAKTKRVLDRCDIAILVASADAWGDFETDLLAALRQRQVPTIVLFNKCDLASPSQEVRTALSADDIPWVEGAMDQRRGVENLHAALVEVTPEEFLATPSLIGDLVSPGGLCVLVVPIDKEAPKGRLIQPQVQTIRDLLDHEAYALVVKERELRAALDNLKMPPDLVVTDSQAFLKVAADTPDEIPMTSFSILFARLKGDLASFVAGARAIDDLGAGDRVLIAESCSHHPITEDIGRVKIPRWLEQYVGGALDIQVTQGHDFPDDLRSYKLVIHCGSCMHNRRSVLGRVARCQQAGVPITNYGIAIARLLGIDDRALKPFAMEL